MPSDSEFMYFRVSRPGTATLRVLVQPQWPQSSMGRSNLNLALTVLDANGSPFPGGSQRGIGIPAYSVTLPAAGIYYTSITGVGAGDPVTTGYSSYGSRGVYQLFVTYPSDGNMDPPPPVSRQEEAQGHQATLSHQKHSVTAYVYSIPA